jgi:hypothetical protein
MLERLSAKARECFGRAEDCAARSKTEPSPATQRDLIEMERLWLELARSYQEFDGRQSSTTALKRRGPLSDRLGQLKREVASQRTI